MPELAEVEYYRKVWSVGTGEAVRRIRLHPQARIFRESNSTAIGQTLTGKTFTNSITHGKKMLFRFSEGCYLGIHLGMSGSLSACAKEMVPSRHEHLVLIMETCALVLTDPRMFGKVLFHQGDAPPDWWANLPPQPQEADFDQRYLNHILESHRRQPLKALLLNQSEFPGIGNWMADEILWQARIHPATTAGSLSPYKRKKLFNRIKHVCVEALRIIGTDWGDPPESWLFSHRWKRGGFCPATGKPLAFETIGGRTTCFSPAIQKY